MVESLIKCPNRPFSSSLLSQYDLALGHAALLITTHIPSLSSCLPCLHDQASLLTANTVPLTAYLCTVLVSGAHCQVSDCIPSYGQMFPPGWCLVTAMEERHSYLWTQIADTTMDRGELVLVMLLILFSPDSEWLALHLSNSARGEVERTQEEWARHAHGYCKQGGREPYRTRLGEIIMTIARVRELVDI